VSVPAPTQNAVHGELELLLVGGGLQAGLIALSVLARRPEARLAVVEAGPSLGGNHTWCLHREHVPASARKWVEPLFAHHWDGYEVRFPRLSRAFDSPYSAITSARLAEVVGAAIADARGATCYLGRRAERTAEHEVELDDGSRLEARVVIDARGPTLEGTERRSGFQKFLGLEIELENPHRVERPILMDATVLQRDGFRFFYVLPFSPCRLLVEVTYFSRNPDLDAVVARADVLEYAARLGPIAHVLREETGVLPMPWKTSPVEPGRSPLAAGYRGGWFHPGTGYSLPIALRLACYVGERAPGDVFGPDLTRMYRAQRRQARFAERLNGLLFRGFAPEDMRNVFERFYGLPQALIQRFYALSTTWADRLRIVGGRPPRGFSVSELLAPSRTG
jgi:lycopene beta-cyclase